MATAFFKAQQDPADEQKFYNSNLGVVHEVKGARVQADDIVECIKDYLVPVSLTSGTITTIGIDQGADIHYHIDAWYPLPISPSNTSDFNMKFRPKLVDYGIVKEFEALDTLMRKWQIRSAVIDANPEKRKALEFASRFDGLVNLCIYGEGVNGKNISKWSTEPTITVDRTAWLDLSLGRFINHTISLPKNLSTEYQDHIRALVRTPMKSGVSDRGHNFNNQFIPAA